MARRTRQLRLRVRTWGGERAGAGRPRLKNRQSSVPHRPRPEHNPRHPVHITLRARKAIPSFRTPTAFAAIATAMATASTSTFRIVVFSVQADHVHAIVESDDKRALGLGVAGLRIRSAKALNRVFDRTGPVWSGSTMRASWPHLGRQEPPSSTSFRTGRNTYGASPGSTPARQGPGLTAGRRPSRVGPRQVRPHDRGHGWRRVGGAKEGAARLASTNTPRANGSRTPTGSTPGGRRRASAGRSTAAGRRCRRRACARRGSRGGTACARRMRPGRRGAPASRTR